jgi:hypothetical protein
MPEDARNRFAEDVYAHRVTKDGKVLIAWQGRTVTTVAGRTAEKLIACPEAADRREIQHCWLAPRGTSSAAPNARPRSSGCKRNRSARPA